MKRKGRTGSEEEGKGERCISQEKKRMEEVKRTKKLRGSGRREMEGGRKKR